MNHSFIIISSQKLIIESFGDEIGISDYITFKKEQISHPDFDSSFNVLSDLRWAEFAFPPLEVYKLVEFFKQHINLEVNRKGCLLTMQPIQTAYSMIFKKHIEEKGVTWNVCTTLTESMSWLNYPLTIEELEVILEDLRIKNKGKSNNSAE